MTTRTTMAAALFLTIGVPLTAQSQAATITMGRTVPFEDASMVPKAVLDECGLPEKHADLLEKAATAQGIKLVRDDDAFKAGKGRILFMQIANSGGGGNAWTGRSRSVAVKGRLVQDGAEIGNFSGLRSSMGGAFGGFKGACALFGRDVEALSKDIAQWLKSPSKDARLGELK